MNRSATIVAVLLCAGGAQSQVVINEVMHDPPGSETNWEFIELYGKPGMDLTGYAIACFKGGADENGDGIPEAPAEIDEAFTLDGLSLGADGFLVLVNSPVGDAAFFTDPAATLSSFSAQHIPTTDTAGNLANGDSTTYLLVRARPAHSVSNGVSLYDTGYSFRKDVDPDVDFDGKIDFGIEGAGASRIDPLQVVDDMAWSNNGGKEYVRSSEQEVSETPNFDPDCLSRINYFGSNPGLGNRVNGSMMVVPTRMADESWIYGEVTRLPAAVGEFPEYGFDTVDMQLPKAPTDPNGPLYDCPPSPTGESDCSPSANGTFLFDDLTVVLDAGLATEQGFRVTPGTFNDDSRFGITQFRFVAADFDFDGDADSDDLALIQSRVGATLDDRIDCVDEFGDPVIDPNTGMPFQCYAWEGRGFNSTEAMRCMDPADGPNGTNAAEITASDVAAAEALIPDDRLCADQNNDGLVTPADFNAWILNFNQMSLLADTNGDGLITPADFNAWILAFNQGVNGPTCNP